ncbi:MAG: hydrolase [Pelagibacterium sp. SCN 63-23]|nr:MAG: hydrolase [Pelagibacterium sp. SCN 63-23]
MFAGASPLRDDLRAVRYLFTDIDDTLTTEGRLLPQTYQALWDLRDAGIEVVPVTGGSAGWCEHIARAWPVHAAIGESGALMMMQREGRFSVEFWEDKKLQAERQKRHLVAILPLLGDDFFLAHDQCFRLADIAIDIVGKPRLAVDALAERIRAIGGTVAISSVHINTWIGDYNKRAMAQRLLERLGYDPVQIGRMTAFVGDSRNDAPMFGYIRNSFGVANIRSVLDDLLTKPRWITQQPAGLGFVDVARALLAAR